MRVIFTCGGDVFAIIWAIVLAALCIYRHRANIKRLLSGTENKLTFKKKYAVTILSQNHEFSIFLLRFVTFLPLDIYPAWIYNI